MRRIKRILATVLLFSMLAMPVQAKTTVTYSDVPNTHWAYNSIRYAAKYNLMQGVGSGKFGLGQKMSRAAYATAVCRLMNWKTVKPAEGSFSDNQDTKQWYYSAIETAYANGALTAEAKTCRPLDVITREEAAVMLLRAMRYATLAGTVQENCPFSDVSTSKGYITLAYRMGIITGIDFITFQPERELTREEAAVLLLRVYDKRNASVTQSTTAAPSGAVRAESTVGTSGTVPLSPRASLESVYAAAVKAGSGGAIVLNTRPLQQKISGKKADEGTEITQEELAELLADEKVEQMRSTRFESSYLLRKESNGASTVVWYESSKDIAEKVDLCRLMGIKTVYIE